jgi:hypothetical protein
MGLKNDPRQGPQPDRLEHRLSELKAASARRHRIAPDSHEHAEALEAEEALQAAIWRQRSSGDAGHDTE